MTQKQMLVAECLMDCERLRKELAVSSSTIRRAESNPVYYVTYPGAALMGRRVANIVVSKEIYARLVRPDSSPEQQSHARWWSENVVCRLVPEGKVVVI